MGGDRLRPSLFERFPEVDQMNVPLLLDYLYGELMHKIGILETQVKGNLSSHEGSINRSKARLSSLEKCPCPVHRDPAHDCVVLTIQETLSAIRADNAAQLASIRTRMAWWGGALAVIIFMLDVAARMLPIFWR